MSSRSGGFLGAKGLAGGAVRLATWVWTGLVARPPGKRSATVTGRPGWRGHFLAHVLDVPCIAPGVVRAGPGPRAGRYRSRPARASPRLAAGRRSGAGVRVARSMLHFPCSWRSDRRNPTNSSNTRCSSFVNFANELDCAANRAACCRKSSGTSRIAPARTASFRSGTSKNSLKRCSVNGDGRHAGFRSRATSSARSILVFAARSSIVSPRDRRSIWTTR